MTAYYGCYLGVPSDFTEGHAYDQIYASVPVLDDKIKIVTWMCRATNGQHRYNVTNGYLNTFKTDVAFGRWAASSWRKAIAYVHKDHWVGVIIERPMAEG